MKVDVKKISTEQRNPNTMDIDQVSTKAILEKINHEDECVAKAIKEAIPQIEKVVDKVYEAFMNDGRLIYMGAGTSGRIGILDSVECPPTFGVGYDQVIGLLAGGTDAFIKAKEGAEDHEDDGRLDLININLKENDVVVGIAASGRTPYVIGGIKYANSIGATTACITTSSSSPLASLVKLPIEVITGPEVITGSTRMKSGTAQKLVCNMISTASMIKMGKVYENLMIDVKPTNEKLVARSINIVKTIINCDDDEANLLLDKYHTIKNVIFHHLTGEENLETIEFYLNKTKGNIRNSITLYEVDKK